MSLLSWICLAPRRPGGTASFEPPPGPPRESSRTTKIGFTSWSHALSQPAEQETAPLPPQQKWLPVIDRDRCIGCERCIAACEHGCLEMIWSFSTLTAPKNCCGEGHCVEACPEQIIHMDWVLLEAPTP